MGRLVLPDSKTMVLAGLTAGEAAVRLNADPQLRGYTFGVRLLPVEPELKPFGYDLFSNVPTTFAPATDIPVPADYVVGPGDTIEVQLIGERGGRYTLTVGRDGVVDFPELGPIAVAGMRFAAAKALLEQRVGGTDDRHARQRLHGRAAFHPGVRAGRGRAAGLLYRERPVNDHQRTVRKRRRQADRLAAGISS